MFAAAFCLSEFFEDVFVLARGYALAIVAHHDSRQAVVAIVFDAHLDLAMNAMNWNRDITRTVEEIRTSEAGMEQKGRCAGTVSLPEMPPAQARSSGRALWIVRLRQILH